MTEWIFLVDSLRDLSQAETPHKVMTVRDYLARPELFGKRRPQVVNLSRSSAYQSLGYYGSLLAEARGHRVIPSVETMTDLASRSAYVHAIPELEDTLNKAASKLTEPPTAAFWLVVCFGLPEMHGFSKFGRLLFDWFRAPVLRVSIEPGRWWRIKRIKIMPPTELSVTSRSFFISALTGHTRRRWQDAPSRTPLRYTLAVLHDPKEAMAPSKEATIRYFARIAARHGIAVEPVGTRDLPRLAEFDALWIRQTTNIDNPTFRFARRAVQEGMPVIDDPTSILRCTNKVYLAERLTAAGLPTPPTRTLITLADVDAAGAAFGYPLVLKIPDGSFSRGVRKAESATLARTIATEMFERSDLLLAQVYMPTAFDWRVGVLGGQPLFISKYMMAKKHWQIVHHMADGRLDEGRFETPLLRDAPADVLEIATRSARLIGNGLYGVDLKQTDAGIFVIEINDNPNLEHGIEDKAEKDAIWNRLALWYVERLAAQDRR